MKYKIEKNTVQETLILPLYSRKLCTELYGSVGDAFFAACPGCHGAGLRLRRWSEH